MKVSSVILSFVFCALISAPAAAQMNIAFVDSDYIYDHVAEFATAQQQLDRLADQWTQDLEERQGEVDRLFQEYKSLELLYTHDERQRKQEEIMLAEEELSSRRTQYFGPEGELYRQQDQLLRPIQEKVLIAIESVAVAEGFDYVFDRSGDYVFLFTDESHNISVAVLAELGIEVQQSGAPGGASGGADSGRSGGRNVQGQ